MSTFTWVTPQMLHVRREQLLLQLAMLHELPSEDEIRDELADVDWLLGE